jgi:2-haloacid dehalogenase
MKLSQFKALTFDCYGTLIDWESGMVEALKPLTGRVTPALTRNRILEAHARHESSQQRWTPTRRYSELLAVVYKRLAEEWGVPASWEECQTYGRSVGNWPAFPDSAEALQYLKKHYMLVILSNVDNESFALSNKRLQVTFDAILTAEDIGSYKPDDRNFRYMLEKLGGLFHDHEPANRAGLTSCWIYRRHGDTGFGATMAPSVTPKYQFRFTSMMEMAKAHQAELAQR